MGKTETIYTIILIFLLSIGITAISIQLPANNKPDFRIEYFNNHSFVTNRYLSCFIHDPDCQCGGSDLEPELNLVNKKVP